MFLHKWLNWIPGTYGQTQQTASHTKEDQSRQETLITEDENRRPIIHWIIKCLPAFREVFRSHRRGSEQEIA